MGTLANEIVTLTDRAVNEPSQKFTVLGEGHF